jgi:hypothetical protein
MFSIGLKPEIRFVAKVDGEGDEAEMFYIAYFKMLGARLTNSTDGGEGLSNPSEEVRRKIGLANLGRKGKPAWNKGKPMSMESKRKLSEAKMGQPAWNKGIPMSIEGKEKSRLAHLGFKHSKESRKIISESLRGRPVSVETREKNRKSNLGKHFFKHSPEAKKKISDAGKNRIPWNKGKTYTRGAKHE